MISRESCGEFFVVPVSRGTVREEVACVTLGVGTVEGMASSTGLETSGVLTQQVGAIEKDHHAHPACRLQLIEPAIRESRSIM